jgi:hypothetical protein
MDAVFKNDHISKSLRNNFFHFKYPRLEKATLKEAKLKGEDGKRVKMHQSRC